MTTADNVNIKTNVIDSNIRPNAKKEVLTVVIAKGIGIILVLAGHFNTELSPSSYELLFKIIYKFHMPLFFLLSGYLLCFTILEPKTYLQFINKKFKRLMYPFMSIAFLLLIIKYIAGMFFKLTHPVTLNSIIQLFLNPSDSFYLLLWFFYTLFLIFAIFPLLLFILKKPFIILILSFLLMFIPWTKYFCLDKVFFNLPFFVFGYIIGTKVYLDSIKISKCIISLILSTLFFMAFYFLLQYIDNRIWFKHFISLILGLSGSLVCVCLSAMLSKTKNMFGNIVKTIGIYSMSIYMLHALFMNSIVIFYFQVFKGDYSYFWFVFSVAMVLGIVFPLIIDKYILRRFSLTRKYVLGM